MFTLPGKSISEKPSLVLCMHYISPICVPSGQGRVSGKVVKVREWPWEIDLPRRLWMGANWKLTLEGVKRFNTDISPGQIFEGVGQAKVTSMHLYLHSHSDVLVCVYVCACVSVCVSYCLGYDNGVLSFIVQLLVLVAPSNL